MCYCSSKSKKSKRGDSKDVKVKSKHHKHVLAGLKRKWTDSLENTDRYASIYSSLAKQENETSTNGNASHPFIPTSQQSALTLCLDPRQPNTAEQSDTLHQFSSHPSTSTSSNTILPTHTISSASSTSSEDSVGPGRALISRATATDSPTIDVSTVDSDLGANSLTGSNSEMPSALSSQLELRDAEGSQSTTSDDWFLDYSKNDYKHVEGKGKKQELDIRKQIRYFAKKSIAKKYDHKFKKHDKGHKN